MLQIICGKCRHVFWAIVVMMVPVCSECGCKDDLYVAVPVAKEEENQHTENNHG